MKELTWLGKCRERELDILIIFGVKIADYFEPPTGIHEEERRLKIDLTERYTFLKTHLEPESCIMYPPEFQTISKSLEQKLDHTYTLLIDQTKYESPGSNGNILQVQYGKCNLIEYALGLKHTKYPNIPYFAYTLNQFLTLKFCFENYQQLAQKQLQTKEEKLKKVQQENHHLKHLLTSIDGFVEAIELTESYTKKS